MKPPRNLGLIINPRAGRGSGANTDLARRALLALGVERVHTGFGSLGADALVGLQVEGAFYQAPESASRAQTLALAALLADLALDAVLVVGGDGTLADVAGIFARAAQPPPMIGIGAGSTNAGALVTCTGRNLGLLSAHNLEALPVPGLLAYSGGNLLGVGFNDCVIGRTVVATIDDRLVDVDVVEKLAGRNQPARPGLIGARGTRVWKTAPGGRQEVARGARIGNVILGLAESPFIAKAITGGVCLASFAGVAAGCLVADFPLVQVELSARDVLNLPPIHSTFIGLNPDEQIHVKGVSAGSALCVDGTPLKMLTPADEVSFGIRTEVVRTVRILKQE